MYITDLEVQLTHLAVRWCMMSVVAFSVDENGWLRSPNLHDGFVDGILLAGENALTVSLRHVQGQRFSMQLVGVEELVCDDFRLGNIIFDVQIVSGIAPRDETLRSLFAPPHPSAAKEFHEQHERFLKQQIDRIKDGSLKLVSIDPSYGCSLRVLCREIIISES